MAAMRLWWCLHVRNCGCGGWPLLLRCAVVMHLHHFTSMANWEQIRRRGALLLCESHVHPRKPGPPVVWLTTREDGEGIGLDQGWTAQQLHDFGRIDKQRVRITVEVSKTFTHKWLEWAPKHGGDPNWVAHVRETIEYAGSWRVHTRIIEQPHWLDCVDMDTGKTLSIAPTPQQLGFKPLRPMAAR